MSTGSLRAAAQLVQNIKVKIQSAIDGGDYTVGYRLTGLADPTATITFAGEPRKLAMVLAHAQAENQFSTNMKTTRSKGGGTAAKDIKDE